MSTKAQIKTQANVPATPAAARIPQHPVAEPEHEAERPDIAAQLEGAARLGHSLGAVAVARSAPPTIQRQEIPEDEEEELQLKREPAAVQRQELPEEEEEELMMKREEGRVAPQGGPVPPEVEAAIQRARGGGQPLEGVLQEQMSASLGHDFSGVRVHTDAEADALNQQISARAFTTGRDIFFRQGEYNPGSGSGRELIGHELTHVVQQGSGRVSGGGSGMIVRPEADAFEQEADVLGSEAAQEHNIGARHRAVSRPHLASLAEKSDLQRAVGNRAVSRLLAEARRGQQEGQPQRGTSDVDRVIPATDAQGQMPQYARPEQQAMRRAVARPAMVGLEEILYKGRAMGTRAGVSKSATERNRPGRPIATTGSVGEIQRKGQLGPPLEIQKGDNRALEEYEWAAGNQITFTPIKSCLGILCASKETLVGLHIAMVDKNGVRLRTTDEKKSKRLAELVAKWIAIKNFGAELTVIVGRATDDADYLLPALAGALPEVYEVLGGDGNYTARLREGQGAVKDRLSIERDGTDIWSVWAAAIS